MSLALDTVFWRRTSRVWAGVLLAAVGIVSFVQGTKLDYDFHHFYRDAAYVWRHGRLNPDLDNPDRARRRQLRFYFPVVALLLAPLTAAGVLVAALLWTCGQLVCLAYSLKVFSKWSAEGGSRAPPQAAVVAATFVALPAVYEAARFNQVSFFVLALVLAGITALERRSPVRAGIWLGLGTAFKLLPGIFAVWLVLKRQWAALAGLLVTTLIVALLPCLIAFGPGDTATYYRQWWHDNVYGAPARGMVDPQLRSHFIDHRNQSIPAVVARVCWSEHPKATAYPPLKLNERACRLVARVIAAVLALALLGLTRGPIPVAGDQEGLATGLTQRRRLEAAVYLLAMLVFSPLLRTYYLVWALPGLVLLARAALDECAPRSQRLGQIGLAIWLIGMLAWLSETARAYGVHLVMLIAIAGILLRLAARQRRLRLSEDQAGVVTAETE